MLEITTSELLIFYSNDGKFIPWLNFKNKPKLVGQMKDNLLEQIFKKKFAFNNSRNDHLYIEIIACKILKSRSTNYDV